MTSQYPSTPEVRDWAMTVTPGAVSMRGELPKVVIAGWNKTHPDRPYVKNQAHHGTPSGYNSRNCRCDRCMEAVRQVSRNRYDHDRTFGATA
jgi:hypothetical protein